MIQEVSVDIRDNSVACVPTEGVNADLIRTLRTHSPNTPLSRARRDGVRASAQPCYECANGGGPRISIPPLALPEAAIRSKSTGPDVTSASIGSLAPM